MPQPIKLPFPKRGVNRNFDRSDQSGVVQGMAAALLPETTWNALNVLPYDRFDRLRGGQRPGTSKLQALALATAPVLGLWQTTIALDPSTLPPTFIAFEEIFGYADGPLQTSSLGAWRAMTNASNPGLDTSTSNTAFTITSHIVHGAGTGQGDTAMYLGGYTLTATYAVQATLNIVDTTTTLNTGAGVMAQIDPVTFNNGGAALWAVFNRHHVTLMQGNNTTVASVTFGSLLTSGNHTINMQVSGTNVKVFIDGVQQISASPGSTPTAGQTGIGFITIGGQSATFSDWQILTLSPQVTFRQNSLIAVALGTIFQGDQTGGLVAATNGTGVLSTVNQPSMAYSGGFAYFVDGKTIQKLNLSSKTVVPYAATAGSAPTNCTIAAVYRDRLVLAAPPATPMNFFMSRVGTQTDWDYSQTDPAAAFAGNASTAGHIGEPITALMPFTDDVMLIGGDHNIWRINGDPADGGSIDLVSDTIGVLGPYAWTKDPTGTIYFLGNAGLYKITAGGQPELLSGQTFNQYFTGLNRATNYITLTWDLDRQGLYIFATPFTSGTGTHLWYDNRNGGLWPIQFPNTHGPMSAITYNGDGPSNRFVLLGGRTGFLQEINPLALDDDGTAITSLLSLGPIQPAQPSGDTVVTGLDITLGENAAADATNVINAVWTLRGGKSAYEVTEGTSRRIVSGVFTFPGRQITRRPRLRGGWFALEISNSTIGKYWSLDQVVIHAENQGKQR